MTRQTIDYEPKQSPAPISLGDHAARGIVWTFMQGGALKVFNLVAQFFLAWILHVADFGYVSMAFAVAALVSLITQAGMKELLIRRWREFDRLATSAFWLMVLLGIVSTALMLGLAPVAGRFFHDDRVTNLIRVLSCQNMFLSLTVVADAKTQIDLRFRFSAVLEFSCSFLLTSFTLIFALLGFKAYSFILPWPMIAVVKCIGYWMRSRVSVRGKPHPILWLEMLRDNGLLMLAATCVMITAQCDYVILGRLYNKDIVGAYFWAFGISTQAIQLLAMNVSYVLMPSLARIQDEPERLKLAFIRAASVLVLIGVPACVLQAVLADPLVRLAFKPEYYAAIPIVEILSLGWAAFVANHSSGTMLKAQGKFFLYLKVMILAVAVFLPSVYIGARLAAAQGAATGVGIYCLIIGPISTFIAIRPLGGKLKDVAKIFGPPLAAGALATVVGFWVVNIVPHGAGRDWIGHPLRAFAAALAVAAIYLPMVRFTAPDAWNEMLSRASRLLHRQRA